MSVLALVVAVLALVVAVLAFFVAYQRGYRAGWCAAIDELTGCPASMNLKPNRGSRHVEASGGGRPNQTNRERRQ